MSLYHKYRPQSLEMVKGNTDLKSSLAAMLANIETCSHTFLLHGGTGCGKTTIARIIAKALDIDIEGSDYVEIDTASNRGIDTVREVIKQAGYFPMVGTYKIWVFDECHKMTADAQNALLKLLEDTPPHVFIVLCTTELQKVIKTVQGRCTIYEVKPLTDTEMAGLLRRILKREGEELDPEIMEQIISDAQGHSRNAIQILEKVLSVPEDRRLEVAKQTAVLLSQSLELCKALMKPNVAWKEIQLILTGLKEQEPESVRRAVLGYAASTLLRSDNKLAGLILEEFLSPFYDSGFPQLVYACFSVINNK